MRTFLKWFLRIFVLAGIAMSIYGTSEILDTVSFLDNATERAKGTFTGYHEEEFVPSGVSFQDSTSYMSYPQFEFDGKDGQKQRITESKNHVIEWFEPGQEVEIIVSPYGDHRLAGFYSLYFRDLCILGLGLCFIFVPLLMGKVILPSLDRPAGARLEKFAIDQYNLIASTKLGPFTVRTFMKGLAIFVGLTVVIGLASSLKPFVDQMHLGFGWGLMEGLENQRFDEARELILKGKGINKVDEFNRNPLLLALEAGRFDLARLLVEAGADVNMVSKMNKTPLQVAVQAGELNMVKLLLSKGASPDSPDDRLPPVFHALAKKHYAVALVLLESCDLQRVYVDGNTRFTVGDLTIMAQRPDLTALVRRRGGDFTQSP